MKKSKIILSLLSLFGLSISISSCGNNDNSSTEIDYEYKINDDLKDKIELSYKNLYDKDLKWCDPIENVTKFNSFEELSTYTYSNTGFRYYGEYNNYHILCEYGQYYVAAEVKKLDYDGEMLFYNNSIFDVSFSCAYVYYDNKLEEVKTNETTGYQDLSSYISKNDALKIKDYHNSYNKKYFGRFLIGDEDYSKAYNRINNELNQKNSESEPTNTKILNTYEK